MEEDIREKFYWMVALKWLVRPHFSKGPGVVLLATLHQGMKRRYFINEDIFDDGNGRRFLKYRFRVYRVAVVVIGGGKPGEGTGKRGGRATFEDSGEPERIMLTVHRLYKLMLRLFTKNICFKLFNPLSLILAILCLYKEIIEQDTYNAKASYNQGYYMLF